QSMLLSMAGMLIPKGGLLSLKAGASQSTVWPALTDDDLAGTINVTPTVARQDKVNSVTAVYPEPKSNYTPVSTPPLAPDAYISADGGLTLDREINYRFTTDAIRAQRLNKLHLSNYREQLAL